MDLLFYKDHKGFYHFFNATYYKVIDVPNNQKIINLLVQKLVCEIGMIYGSEIKGKGGNLHKGIKKLIMANKDIEGGALSVREIKKIFRSVSTKKIIGKKITEKVFIPYRSALILSSVFSLLAQKDGLTNEFKQMQANNTTSQKGLVDILIPQYYTLLRRSFNVAGNIESQKKAFGKYVKDKLTKALGELDELNKKTI